MNDIADQALTGEIVDDEAPQKKPRPTGPVRVTLSKPIQNIDQTVTVVTINPPTGRHLMKAGAVMRFSSNDETGENSVEIKPDGMGKLIGACGNLAVRAVESMAAADFMAVSNVLMGFLIPTEIP